MIKFSFFILIVASALFSEINTQPNKVVCYYGSWATYRNGNGRFDVENIDVQKCTHIIYTFIGINSDGTIKILDKWNEIDLGALKRFTGLKSRNKNLKTLIAIGGWNEGSVGFSKVVGTTSLRNKFVQSALDFMETYGFDGFDLDWEYPAQRGGASSDKANFAKLVKSLRETFDATGKKYLLTAAVAATATATDISYDVPALSKYLDFINVMAYDFHGSYDKVTGQNAPLYASSLDVSAYDKERNVAASISAWLARGAAPEKIVLGLGAYGRSYTLSSSSKHDLGSPASNGGNQGPYTQEVGMLGYHEICEKQKEGGWTEKWDDQQKVPYMYKGNQWVGYDNPRSIKLKVEYAKSMKLGGLMVWSVETDDFKGICGVKNPILSAIVEAMGNTNTDPEITTQKPNATTKKPTTTTTKPTTTTQSNEGGSVGVKCTNEGYLRDPNNCAVFYVCEKFGSLFKKTEMKCSGNLVFDLEVNVCNYPSQVNC